jgi:hypothetical protein
MTPPLGNATDERAGEYSAGLDASDHADHQLYDFLVCQFLSAQEAPHKEVDRMPDSRGKQNALTMVHAMGREWAQLGHVLHIA